MACRPAPNAQSPGWLEDDGARVRACMLRDCCSNSAAWHSPQACAPMYCAGGSAAAAVPKHAMIHRNVRAMLSIALISLSIPAAPAADSAACAACHRAIYESYRRTPMALSSGAVSGAIPSESFAHASFTHIATGFRYRIRQSGGYWLDFEKTDGALHATKPLAYFI